MTRRPAAPHVEVVIDAVVVHGMPRAQASALVTSLEQTLTALAIGDANRLTSLRRRTIAAVRPPELRAQPRSSAGLGAYAATAIWNAAGGRR